VGRQVAGAAPHETPARKITRLRAKAARVQAAIDRMNARVERLVEDYNEVREALARTRVEQARTREQVLEARRRLRVARRQLGKRLWTIYTGGAPSTLGQLLGADSIHQALVTTKYQEEVVGADRAAVDRVERLRRQVEARLSAQRRYHQRLTRQVRRAVAEERRRQAGLEALRRRALLRRLAAARAARAATRAGAPSGAAGRAVAFARSQLGKPYVWGRPVRAPMTAPAWSWRPTAAPGCGCRGSAGSSGTPAPTSAWAAWPRATWCSRLQRGQPLHHPPRRHVRRRRRHGRGPLFRGQGPHRLHRPPRLHRRRPPDRLTVSGGRKGFFLLDFGGRDPRGPTPRTSI
jgi:hypothetical protein